MLFIVFENIKKNLQIDREGELGIRDREGIGFIENRGKKFRLIKSGRVELELKNLIRNLTHFLNKPYS